MEIKPTYITFEQAKLLKEKWFNENVEGLYFDAEIKVIPTKPSNTDFASTRYYSAPEQWQVIEWLRIKHGIWVSVEAPVKLSKSWCFEIYKIYDGVILNTESGFSSPQEAYSSAFDYILKEII
jgi:hypothetical protein